MRWLLDTNVVSELRRRHPARRVEVWAESQNPFDTYLSAMTIFELEVGARRKERTDPTMGAALRRWVDHLVNEEFAGRILAVDAQVARVAAQMHVPDPRPERDALIAATALHHNLTVVTRNVRDFTALNVRTVDPWA